MKRTMPCCSQESQGQYKWIHKTNMHMLFCYLLLVEHLLIALKCAYMCVCKSLPVYFCKPIHFTLDSLPDDEALACLGIHKASLTCLNSLSKSMWNKNENKQNAKYTRAPMPNSLEARKWLWRWGLLNGQGHYSSGPARPDKPLTSWWHPAVGSQWLLKQNIGRSKHPHACQQVPLNPGRKFFGENWSTATGQPNTTSAKVCGALWGIKYEGIIQAQYCSGIRSAGHADVCCNAVIGLPMQDRTCRTSTPPAKFLGWVWIWQL